jgi:hypothetical protein
MKTAAIITGQARTIKTAQGDRTLIYAQVASGINTPSTSNRL